MDSWFKEYALNKDDYNKLFDESMQEKQEQDIEFFENTITNTIGRKYAVACQSATDALMFSLITLGIKPGDEVLTTNFSWIATASCISMVGATPVFCDIDKETYHMSLDSIKKMYSDKVKAIVYPHLFGNMSDTTKILEFCKEKNIFFVEDAAQSIGSSFGGVKAGTLGDLSAISFNANKTISGIAGGGAVVTNNKEYADTIVKLRKHGNNEMLGYNSKMLFFNAKFIDYRLKKLNEYIEKKQAIAKKYDEQLKDEVIIQSTSNGVNHTYHKYIIRFKNKETRNRVKERLNADVHYEKPISELPMYKNIPYRSDDCINCKHTGNTILTLPIDPYLTDKEINDVCNIILSSL